LLGPYEEPVVDIPGVGEESGVSAAGPTGSFWIPGPVMP